jgi:MFS family permease
VNILATIPAIMLIDRIGRKPLLLIGSVGMTLTLGAMAAVFATGTAGPDGKPLLSHMAAVAGLTAANLYIVAFAVSWGPVMWVLLGEMFPNEIRGAALAISGATNWVANFTVTVTFLPLLKAIGLTGAYAFYATAAAISLPFVWLAVRETKDETLEQMKDSHPRRRLATSCASFVTRLGTVRSSAADAVFLIQSRICSIIWMSFLPVSVNSYSTRRVKAISGIRDQLTCRFRCAEALTVKPRAVKAARASLPGR